MILKVCLFRIYVGSTYLMQCKVTLMEFVVMGFCLEV